MTKKGEPFRVGERIGSVTVVDILGPSTGRGRDRYLLKCDCGEEKVAEKGNISQSKGRCTHTRIGVTQDPLYGVWASMKQRCGNPNDSKYRLYGGRGISVCERWASSFENFKSDMGSRPDGTTLDRINGNGDYCPENCRWADLKTQNRNTSRNRTVCVDGVQKTIAELSEESGMDYDTLYYRLFVYKWPVEKSVSTPVWGYHWKRQGKEAACK